MINFAIDGSHKDFFRKQQWLECEELLSSQELSIILNTPILNKKNLSSEELFDQGRDLWRTSAQLKKIFLNKNLANVAAELTNQRQLRFGFDQLFLAPTPASFGNKPGKYHQLLTKTLPLQEISSLQNTSCGLMLCIQQPESSLTQQEEDSPLFTLSAGNGVFFHPNFPIFFDTLNRRQGFIYLLLTYATSNAVYCQQVQDPQGRKFQQLGYNFGDRLSEQLNPLVYP